MNVRLRSLTACSVVVLLSLAACSKSQDFGPIDSASPSDNGIIGGTVVTDADDYSKTIVSLYDLSQGSLCTASILTDSILVTAAHCVGGPAGSLRVVFGKDFTDRNTRVVQGVVSYETSPLWAARENEEFNSGDIAVVRYSGGLPAGFHPAKILANTSELKNGVMVLLAGYGISDGVEKSGSGILRSVEVPIQNAAFSETEILIDQTSHKGACHGDSGGPAYVKVNNEWVLWGVTNRGVNDPNNDCSVSAAYASIPFYKNWITKTAKKLLSAPTVPAATRVFVARR